MKKSLIFVFILVALISTSIMVNASGAPRRSSTSVTDVFEPYTPEEMIVSTDEEPIKDQAVKNAPECDISSVISCYDNDYLRVDILLNKSISFKWDILYAIKLEYDDMNEYFIYYTDSQKLVYEVEKNGMITKTKTLTADNSKDTAGVTNSGKMKNSDVYFIIEKKAHIDGESGKKYYLTCKFLSGFIDKKGKIQIADETIPVDLEFIY